MFTLCLPNSKDQKPLSYHYQTQDKLISDFLILGTLFRALPYFPQVYISSSNSQITNLQSILKNPLQIQFGQPKSKNCHTITISSQNNPEAHLISTISINPPCHTRAESADKRISTSGIYLNKNKISTLINQSDDKNQIISITGNGKGKTTIGLGLMLFNYLNQQIFPLYKKGQARSCRGMFSSYHFFKDRNFADGISEFNFPDLVKNSISSPCVQGEQARSSLRVRKVLNMHSQNSGFLFPNANQNDIKKHQQSTQTFFAQIKKTIQSQNYDLILLDEIIDALIAGLINQRQLEEIITLVRENNVKLVLTGRYTISDKFNITKLFDTNITVTKIKHPYDSGIKAVKGLDY